MLTGYPSNLRQQGIRDYSRLLDAFVEKAIRVGKSHELYRYRSSGHSIHITMFENEENFARGPF